MTEPTDRPTDRQRSENPPPKNIRPDARPTGTLPGMTEPDFIPGLELSRRFYTEAVRPVLDAAIPALAHSAARIGSGSEVLGFDTPRSADHEWGPRLQLFLSPADVTHHGHHIEKLLSER